MKNFHLAFLFFYFIEFINPSYGMKPIPIVYSPKYEFDLFGLETHHPFLNKKYSKIIQFLLDHELIQPDSWISPTPPSIENLRSVHPQPYLSTLSSATAVFEIIEPIKLKAKDDKEKLEINLQEISNRIVNTEILGAGGTLLASKIALNSTEKWAINLSGGYHHAHPTDGCGFCLIADGPLAIYDILDQHPLFQILIIDLDAHHGDGNASFFAKNSQVHIFDIYNKDNFPFDMKLGFPNLLSGQKNKIDFDFPIPKGTLDSTYLSLLSNELPKAIESLRPDVIFYNAGTDIYKYDPLGGLNITAEGIIERDEIVFSIAKKSNIPIFMVMSGGYAASPHKTASRATEISTVIGMSIANLITKKIIQMPQ